MLYINQNLYLHPEKHPHHPDVSPVSGLHERIPAPPAPNQHHDKTMRHM